MVIFLAGILAIDRSLYESADIDGASSFKIFFNITLPMLAPVTFFVVVLSSIRGFNVFDLVSCYDWRR